MRNINFLSIFVLFASLFDVRSSSIGFGIQKLKDYKSKIQIFESNQKLSSTCDNVVQYWYRDAVIDNFAPIEDQVKWFGEGILN